jgi:hypothetical protein
LGLEAEDALENVFAGVGDSLTFGATAWVRDELGIDGVDTSSGWYTAGEFAAAVGPAAIDLLEDAAIAGYDAIFAEDAAAAEKSTSSVPDEAVPDPIPDDKTDKVKPLPWPPRPPKHPIPPARQLPPKPKQLPGGG